MPFVVELYFDATTEARIRDAWKALDEAGISDSMPKGGYRPHISLGVCDHLETDPLAQELSIICGGYFAVSTVVPQHRHLFYIGRGCLLRCHGYRAIARYVHTSIS